MRTIFWVVDEGAVDIQCYLVLVSIRGQVLPRGSLVLLFGGASEQQGPYGVLGTEIAACVCIHTGCATQSIADQAVGARRKADQMVEVAGVAGGADVGSLFLVRGREVGGGDGVAA